MRPKGEHRARFGPHEALRFGVVVGISPAAHRARELVLGKQLPVGESRVLGGFKRSSQHLDGGGCDEHSKAAFGSIWAGAIVVTRSTAGGGTR